MASGMDPTTSPSQASAERVWRPSDVARYYQRSVRTIERWVADGRLPAPRLDPGGRPFWLPGQIRDDAASRVQQRRAPTRAPVDAVVEVDGHVLELRIGGGSR